MANSILEETNETQKKSNQILETWKRLRKSKIAVLGLIIIIVLIISAIFADIIAPYSFDDPNLEESFQSPSRKHIFGTDELGRDIFSRIVHGSRISLKVGFIVVTIGLIVGGFLGAVAGYSNDLLDNIIMRLMDLIMSIPQILLAIAILAALGQGLRNVMIAVGVSSIPRFARVVRASVLSVKEEEFIEAAKASGSGYFRILLVHIIPNCMAPLLVQSTLGVANAILTAAALSFLGIGIQPPTPEWGAMLSGGRGYIRDYAYMTMFPGLAIATTIFALNVLGDGLRDALDPKLRN